MHRQLLIVVWLLAAADAGSSSMVLHMHYESRDELAIAGPLLAWRCRSTGRPQLGLGTVSSAIEVPCLGQSCFMLKGVCLGPAGLSSQTKVEQGLGTSRSCRELINGTVSSEKASGCLFFFLILIQAVQSHL